MGKDKIDDVLKEIDFDTMRENFANAIGTTKERLFHLVYGDEEEKEEYFKYLERLTKIYEKRPKE